MMFKYLKPLLTRKKLKTKKVLLFHGLFATGINKFNFINSLGYEATNPKLSNWSFKIALEEAQKAYDELKPDVIVGASRGGALAMNIKTGKTPLILMAPAWKYFGVANFVSNPNSYVIHAWKDSLVPYADSLELYENSSSFKLLGGEDAHSLNGDFGRESLEKCLKKILKV